MAELNLPFNLIIIVSRLPYKRREKWRSTACEILECSQKRPDFTDLVAFIEKEAKILLDSVFREIQDPKTNSNVIKTMSKQSVIQVWEKLLLLLPLKHQKSCRDDAKSCI